MDMDIHRIWTWTQFFTHGFFHGRAKTVFMDMDMDLTSLYGLYGRMDMAIVGANLIRKGVAAKCPIWLFQGVVAAINFR